MKQRPLMMRGAAAAYAAAGAQPGRSIAAAAAAAVAAAAAAAAAAARKVKRPFIETSGLPFRGPLRITAGKRGPCAANPRGPPQQALSFVVAGLPSTAAAAAAAATATMYSQ